MISVFSSNNWITVVIILLMLVLSFLKIFNEKQFTDFISLSKEKEYYSSYIKSTTTIFNKFNIYILFFQILTFSLLILKFDELILNHQWHNRHIVFLKIAFGLFSYYLVRTLIGYVIAFIIEMEENQKALTVLKLTYLSKASILSFPLLFVLEYIKSLNRYIPISFLILLLVYISIKYIQILIKNKKLIFSNIFYSILYLCALEITPLVIVYKLFIDKG